MASMQPEDAPRSREQAKQWKKERKLQAQRKAKETASATAEAKAARRPSPPPSVQLSKALAYILRHGAEKEHLPVRPDGFIQVDAVLARPRVQKVPMMEEDTVRAPTLEDIQAIVRDNDKKRFELVEGAANSPTEPGTCWWIRAVQGHSLDQITDLSHIPLTVENVSSHLQALLPTSTSCQAIHGTNDEAWTQIEASQALRRMQRNHIHLAKGVPGSSGVISGMRTSCTRLLYVNVSRALEDGVPFVVSSNGVILTPGVGETGALPLTYVECVTDAQGTHIWP